MEKEDDNSSKNSDIEKLGSQPRRSSQLKKCFRTGDNICYSDLENITMLRRIPEDAGRQESSESMKNLDKIRSGESLYKSFSFDESENDEEVQKCIAFWKSIMERNLEPLKCTLIEKCALRPTKIAERRPHNKYEQNVVERAEKLDSESQKATDNVWLKLFKEIQKKKLHKIKLMTKARCNLCDSDSTLSMKDEGIINRAMIEQEVKDLNNWPSKSSIKPKNPKNTVLKVNKVKLQGDVIARPKENEVKNQGKTIAGPKENASKVLTSPKGNEDKVNVGPKENEVKNQGEVIASSKKKEGKVTADPQKNEGKVTVGPKENKVKSQFDAKKPKKEPDKGANKVTRKVEPMIVLEKKQTGKYSEWRKNKVKTKCACRQSNCSCNTNPAVVRIEKINVKLSFNCNNGSSNEPCPAAHAENSIDGEETDKSCKSSKSHSCNSTLSSNEDIARERLTRNNMKADNSKNDWLTIAKETAVATRSMKNCDCGYNDCDCTKPELHTCECDIEFCRCSLMNTTFGISNEMAVCFEPSNLYSKPQMTPSNLGAIPTNTVNKKMYSNFMGQCEEVPEVVERSLSKGYYCIICDSNNCDCTGNENNSEYM